MKMIRHKGKEESITKQMTKVMWDKCPMVITLNGSCKKKLSEKTESHIHLYQNVHLV